MTGKKKAKKMRYLYEFILAILSCLTLYPVFLIFADSFKTRKEMASNPFWLSSPGGFTLDNMVNAISKMKFHIPLLNSSIITVLTLLLLVIVASMAAYPIARRNNRVYRFFYMFFLAGLIVPYQLAMISLYKEIKMFGLMNSQLGMVLIYGGVFLSFPVFFYSGFIRTIPVELEEAAFLDGCSRYKIFWEIVFPLLKPITATVLILNLMNVWNEFALALLFLQKSSTMTITIALSMFRGQYSVNWPQMFAGVLVAVTPVIAAFLAVQKQFIKGVVDGAIKG